MLCIPPLERSLSTSAIPVLDTNPKSIAFIISPIPCPPNVTAKKPPNRPAIAITANPFTFFTANIITIIIGKNAMGLIK